jgi:beta-galactosidase
VPEDLHPQEPHRWHLVSEGFYGVGEVWLNGTRVDEVDGQYLGFRLDVSSQVLPGRSNVIGIRLNNSYHPFVLPGKKHPDFLLYGGMAGRVFLQRVPVLSIEPFSFRILCADPLSASPTLLVTLSVRNLDNKPRAASAHCRIHDNDDGVVFDVDLPSIAFRPGLNHEIAFSCVLEHPRRWDLESPNLYNVTCSLRDGTTRLHNASSTIGIREAIFRANEGFFLNGKRTPLLGANRHESMPGFGNALPDVIHRMDARLFKEIGLNIVRLSHYPQNPAFLDACDELGILVYPEIASWKSVRPGPWQRAARRQMQAMILRDRNRPSIVLWGMGNESRSKLVFNSLRQILDTYDHGTSTIYAENHLHRGERSRTLRHPDVLGVNYELNRLDDACSASRNGSLLISEMSNSPYAYRSDRDAEIKQVETIERDLAACDNKEYVAGTCLWSFNDYATQRKQRYFRHCGLVDAWRVPKMSAAYIRARTCKEPHVSLHAEWNANGGDGARRVHVFTNCDEVTLHVDDRLISTLAGKWHIQTELEFETRVLTARATQGGKHAADSIAPWGPARSLNLSSESTECIANQRETVVIRCVVTDTNGQHAADWQGEVSVLVDGPARGRFYSEKAAIPIAGGIGHIFITGTGTSGDAIITATHTELETGECTARFI